MTKRRQLRAGHADHAAPPLPENSFRVVRLVVGPGLTAPYVAFPGSTTQADSKPKTTRITSDVVAWEPVGARSRPGLNQFPRSRVGDREKRFAGWSTLSMLAA